jgi:hypothetical protein
MNQLIRSNLLTTPVLGFVVSLSSPATVAAAPPSKGDSSKHSTQWRIEPSFKYDAFCLLNTLTGDPFYLWHYSAAYGKFAPKLTPEAKKAVAHLKKVIKDDGGGIISARLCLLFSAVEDESLDDLLATADHPEKLRANFAKTPYWDEEEWRGFESIWGDLRVIFNWYKQIGFDAYWRDKVRPIAEKKAKEMLAQVSNYDVIPLVEKHLGKPLQSDTITVYMLNYSQPHGIKITGTRFLTDVAWPFEIVVRNSVHEMMHPPYRLEGDKELAAVLDSLRADKFLLDKVEHHNPSFGYNTLEGFVDEDSVQALDQIINEILGVADKPKHRWTQSDGGMHVLAVALYQMMKEENYPSGDKSFRDFLVRMNKEGEFKSGSIEAYHRAMYGKK